MAGFVDSEPFMLPKEQNQKLRTVKMITSSAKMEIIHYMKIEHISKVSRRIDLPKDDRT